MYNGLIPSFFWLSCLLYCCSLPAQVPVNPRELPPREAPEPKMEAPAPEEGREAEAKEKPFPDRAAEILDYWFGNATAPDYFNEEKTAIWLADDPETARELRDNFTQDVLNARNGSYNNWRITPRGRLALIILLDQIPRHIYRNQPQAFSSDPMAVGLVIEGMQKGVDTQLVPIERAFFYLPLEHAEDPELQAMSVAAYQRLLTEAPFNLKPVMRDFLDYAHAHQQQIMLFGRFPARNAILGRKSTPEEMLFLQQTAG